MVTVLDKLTSKDFALATLLSQLQSNFEAKAAERSAEVEAQFGQKLGSVEIEKRPNGSRRRPARRPPGSPRPSAG